MSEKTFAFVGKFVSDPAVSGLDIYKYSSADGSLTPVGEFLKGYRVGQQFEDKKSGIMYLVNEVKDYPGVFGAGGTAVAVKFDPETGKVDILSELPTLTALPAYIAVDKSRKYAIVTPHNSSNYVIRTTQLPDGTYTSYAEFDDAAVILYSLKEDGSLDKICDVMRFSSDDRKGPSHLVPHLHSVYEDPTGELYIVSDKGLDKVYALKIDREKSKLVLTTTVTVEDGYHPRYGAYHPTLKLFYGDNENKPYVFTYSYDEKTGFVKQTASTCLFTEEEMQTPVHKEPCDIVITEDGKYMYVGVRNADRIFTLSIDGEGGLEVIQNIPAEGKNPRGFTLSPDGKYLFVQNMASDKIDRFKIGADGKLTYDGKAADCVRAANMRFLEL